MSTSIREFADNVIRNARERLTDGLFKELDIGYKEEFAEELLLKCPGHLSKLLLEIDMGMTSIQLETSDGASHEENLMALSKKITLDAYRLLQRGIIPIPDGRLDYLTLSIFEIIPKDTLQNIVHCVNEKRNSLKLLAEPLKIDTKFTGATKVYCAKNKPQRNGIPHKHNDRRNMPKDSSPR